MRLDSYNTAARKIRAAYFFDYFPKKRRSYAKLRRKRWEFA